MKIHYLWFPSKNNSPILPEKLVYIYIYIYLSHPRQFLREQIHLDHASAFHLPLGSPMSHGRPRRGSLLKVFFAVARHSRSRLARGETGRGSISSSAISFPLFPPSSSSSFSFFSSPPSRDGTTTGILEARNHGRGSRKRKRRKKKPVRSIEPPYVQEERDCPPRCSTRSRV